jgi:sulfate transport system substrate-binding protein
MPPIVATPLSRRRLAALGLVAGGAAAAPALVSPRRAAAQDVTLTLVAYTTPREAYEEIIPLFRASDAGAGVQFDQSYGASGDQSRAVEAGLPADVVALSLAPDITRLVDAGLVAETWAENEHGGMVSDSVVALAVRAGNPKSIAGWDDLLREDVETLTPNPQTSGGARWNVLAAWGAQIEQGKTEDEATEFLRGLFQRVPVQDKSARESLQTYVGGVGDVLIGYENEFILAQANGEELEYVVPEQTILIENPAAVVNTSAHPDVAQSFIDFLTTPDIQRLYGEKGYRPVLEDILAEFDYPVPANLFTVADLGGWEGVTDRFFNPDTGIVAVVQQG